MNGEKGEMKGKNIQLKIVKLPHEIDTDKSYHEVGNGVHLHSLAINEFPKGKNARFFESFFCLQNNIK